MNPVRNDAPLEFLTGLTRVQRWKGGGNEYPMDCQYEYSFVGPSDHHGFLPHHPIECIDPLAEKRIKTELRISDCGMRS